jgi:hypothetical protein
MGGPLAWVGHGTNSSLPQKKISFLGNVTKVFGLGQILQIMILS